MYISENCSFIPYSSHPILDAKVNDLDLTDSFGNYDKVVRFLSNNYNYGLDEIFRRSQIEETDPKIKEYIAKQGYGLDILINDTDAHVRCKVAEQGYGLDILINDENPWVRSAVAEQGYGLNILIDDENLNVRIEVAKQGYDLDKLINDKEWWVRCEVAKKGYGLDILISDEDFRVREEVAEQGYGLDKLIGDENHSIRWIVAEHGYGLDKLINDINSNVREGVIKYLKENNQTLLSWWNENADKHYYESFHDIINENVEDNSEELINQLIKANMYLDWVLKNIDNPDIKEKTTLKMREMGYTDIQEWKENYPSNVYYNLD